MTIDLNMIKKNMKFYKTLTLIIYIFFSITQSTLLSQELKKEKSNYKKAEKYFFTKKFEMAEILFQEEIKKNPENATAYSYLGDIFLQKKRYNGALSLYKKALDLNPNISENYYRIGQVYYYKKLGNLAIQSYEKAYEINNKLKHSNYQIGLTYLMLLRKKDKTIEYWQKYLALAPEDPQYESIRRVIELLKDPNFKIPEIGSEISIEEALLLGGETLKKIKRDTTDKKADHEKKKSKEKIEELYLDDDL